MIGNNNNGVPEIPLGLGMALAQNSLALKRFAALSITEQQSFIDSAHEIRSSAEMRAYVDTLKEGNLQ